MILDTVVVCEPIIILSLGPTRPLALDYDQFQEFGKEHRTHLDSSHLKGKIL